MLEAVDPASAYLLLPRKIPLGKVRSDLRKGFQVTMEPFPSIFLLKFSGPHAYYLCNSSTSLEYFQGLSGHHSPF